MHGSLTEWLQTDGLGGFASGTVSGRRTRRYHAWLLSAQTPPTGRLVLVNGAEVQVITPAGEFPLSTQLYSPDVAHPRGDQFLTAFQIDPWPTWTYQLPDGTSIQQELWTPHGATGVVVRWHLRAGAPETQIKVRPLLSGRDYHCLHHANPAFSFEAQVEPHDLASYAAGLTVRWQPYHGIPQVIAETNGTYQPDPLWFYRFRYEVEAERGLDCEEDLAAPGVFTGQLGSSDLVLVLTTDHAQGLVRPKHQPVTQWAEQLAAVKKARRMDLVAPYAAPLQRAVDDYIVQRGAGKTIIAGYPWFTDWGRDTFIALRGLCLTSGRLEDARRILVDWSNTVSEGMLPNRFPDYGSQPEFNSVDASLWYVIAVSEFLQVVESIGFELRHDDRARMVSAIKDILRGYSQGTRFNIRATSDGLLQAGQPGVQLTWMDAKVGDWVVTPRIGKPVEIQALWLNALRCGADLLQAEQWERLSEVGRASFQERFWNDETKCLFDVIDVDHELGKNDPSIRPNQLLAVGGLPIGLLDDDRARRVVDVAELLLVTPLGLRTLARDDSHYHGRFTGGIHERDGAYHQGTVWPWLLGPFVSAWLRVRGHQPEAKAEARRRFIEPMLQHLDDAGLGHVSEVADGDAPHAPRGCPFQAWSLGELIRAIALCDNR